MGFGIGSQAQYRLQPTSKITVVVTGVGIIVLAVVAVLTLSKIEKDAQVKTGIALQTVLQTSQQAFHSWAGEISREALIWAQTPSVKALTYELLNTERTQEGLVRSAAQEQIRGLLFPVHNGKGYLGFFIIAPDGISLASTRDANTGVPNLLADQPGFVERILSGETAVSLPQRSDVPLLDASGKLRGGQPTMFVGAPIQDDAGEVIAFLAFRVAPDQSFTAIFQRGRLGETGETYAFNQDGILISESRFDSDLRRIGLIAIDQRGILNIPIRDPGVHPDKGERVPHLNDEQPYTLMAKNAISGEAGINLEGYRDYRGVEVVGAWLWDEQYGLGITTEIDTEEIYNDLRTTQIIFIGFAVLASVAFVILAATFEFNRRRNTRAQAALVAAQSNYQDLFEHANDSIFIVDPDTRRFLDFNENAAKQLGYTRDELLTLTIMEIDGSEVPERSEEKLLELVEKGELIFEHVHRRKDGSLMPVEISSRVIDSGGQQVFQDIARDITERNAMEEQLRSAQRMEAVGQLTGGVAHDFNNLLAVILGNAELLHDEIGDNHLLASIDRAGTRGAELTQRLLAFSRRQKLAPQSIDLVELVSGHHDLLQRTLGESVKVLTDVSEDIWPVLADPGQLENALLNLAINARDAMPDGGILEISCGNVQLRDGDMRVADGISAGDYVQIAVRDTGTGMPEDVLEHAFEPFFTTKDVGEGTGLGLSMVYGFTRQSGGDATIESEPCTGTEVRLLLPRAEEDISLDEPIRGKERKRGQGEAILVLEDDPGVRSFAVNALEGLGYRVHQATDATEAIQVLEEEADNLDLLLSDMVLPGGVSGPELAAKAKDLYPELKVVFMTGYAADLYTHDKIPGFDETLLNKPFKLAELAKVIHDTLAA